ncbi:unnamed protein product, partial [Closterium sp. Yama58-4]
MHTVLRYSYHPSLAAAATRASHFRSQSESAFAFDLERSEGENASEWESEDCGGSSGGSGSKGGIVEGSRFVPNAHRGLSATAKVVVNDSADNLANPEGQQDQAAPLPSSRASKPQSPLPRHRRYRSDDAFSFHEPSTRAAADESRNTAGSFNNSGSGGNGPRGGGGSRGGGVMTMVQRGMQLLSPNGKLAAGKDGGRGGGRGGQTFNSSSKTTVTGARHATSIDAASDDGSTTRSSASARSPTSPSDGNRDAVRESTEADAVQQKSPGSTTSPTGSTTSPTGSTTSPTGSTRIARNTVVLSGAAAAARKRGSSRGGSICQELLPSLWEEEDERAEGTAAGAGDRAKNRGATGTPAENAEVAEETEAGFTGDGRDRYDYYARRKSGSAIPRSRERWQAEDEAGRVPAAAATNPATAPASPSASAIPRVPSPTGLPPRPMSPSDADPLQSRHAQMSPTTSPPNHRRTQSSGTFLWGAGMMGGLPPTSPRTSAFGAGFAGSGAHLPPLSPRAGGRGGGGACHLPSPIGRSKTTGGSSSRVSAGGPLADVASLPRSRTSYAAMGEGGGGGVGGGGGAGGGGRVGMGGEGRAAGGGGHFPILNRGKGTGGGGGGVPRSASSGNVAGMGQSGASMGFTPTMGTVLDPSMGGTGVPRSASSGNVAGMAQNGAGMGVSGAGMGFTPTMGTMLDPARGGSGVPRSASSGNMAGNMGGSMGGSMGGMGGMGFTPTMGTVLGSAGVPRSASSGNMGGMGASGAGMGGSGAGMGGSTTGMGGGGAGTRLSGLGLGSPGAHKGGAHRRTSSVSSGGAGGGSMQQHGYSLSSPRNTGIIGRHRRSASTSHQPDPTSTNLPDSSRPKGFRAPRIVLPHHDSISPATSPHSTSPRGSSSLAPGDTSLKSPYTSPPNASPLGTPPSPSYRLPPHKASASAAAHAMSSGVRVLGPAQLLGGFTTAVTGAAGAAGEAPAIPATFSRSPRHRSPTVLSPSLRSPSLHSPSFRSPNLKSPSLPSPGVIRTGSSSPGGNAASNLIGFSSPTYLPSPASSASLNANSPYANYPYTPGGGSVVHSPQSMAALAERDKQKLAEIQSFFASGAGGLASGRRGGKHGKTDVKAMVLEGAGGGKAGAKTTVQAGAGEAAKKETAGVTQGLKEGKSDVKAMVQAALEEWRRKEEAAMQQQAASVLGRGLSDVRKVYQLGKELGRGNFGVIREAVDWVSGERFACKSVNKKRLEVRWCGWQTCVGRAGRVSAGDRKAAGAGGVWDVRGVYQLGKELGRGNFGVMREAKDWVSGERFACKSVNKKRLECLDDVEDLRREVEVMRLLKGHPNIVSQVDTYEDDTDVHIVMELCEGGELFDRIVARNHFSERQAAQVCRTLADVLRYCHSHHILHRDLKPENVLLVSTRSDTRVKVIDFGMAYRFQEGERCTQRAGTPNYISPEVIAKNYGTEADVWSLGVILYVMLCGLPPFWGDTTEEIFSSILYEPLDLETEPWPDVSAAAKDLVRRMLCRRFDERITVPEILSELGLVCGLFVGLIARLTARGMEEDQLTILVESRDGDSAAQQATTVVALHNTSDLAGRPRADADDGTAWESGFSGDARDRSRQGSSNGTSADSEAERNGVLHETNSQLSMLSGPGSKVAGDASDYGGDGDDDEGDGVGEDADLKVKDIEAPIRVRRVDFNAESENHYVIVIHGTFDAPPADGAPTWYQPPPPGEQNFCRKLSRLLALGPIGEDAIWRDLPCSALPGIPYPFHWDGTNTHAGRVTAAMKLHNLIDQIAQNDPAARIHLVAHSHGGNVMLKTIELYLAKIGRRQKGEWHPAVERQFWVAHRRSYELIKKWRRIDMRQSWWRFFPFLVVYRGFNGQKTVGVKESYPWAYHQWLDSLLRLPSVRQRRFLAFRHATSPITNALGALVFLGTPFYIKKWQTNGLLWFALSLVFSVALMYVFIIAYTSFIQFIVLLIAGRLQDFYTQSGPHFLIATSVMLLVLIKQIMDAVGNTVFYSGNLYHNPAFDWSPAMSALVIHAGKLDEASLALSMEPITRAYVFPHLTKLLKQTPWAPFPKPPTRYARQVDWWAFLFHCAIILVWDTLFFLPAAIMSVCSHIIAPIVTGTIQKMVVTISFGLSAGDLNHAYIYVDEHLDLDLATQQVDQWNVQ